MAARSACPINRLAKAIRFLHTAAQGTGIVNAPGHKKMNGEVTMPAMGGQSRTSRIVICDVGCRA